jgi:M6 family metalloprotease-like protein
MKTSKPSRLGYLSILLAGCVGYASAAPYGPNGREIKWTQPSGEKLKLRVYGDEYYARTETLDGHSVVYNPKDGAYHYAKLSSNSNELIPSGTKADGAPPANTDKHLDLPKSVIRSKVKANHVKFDGDRQKRWNARVEANQFLNTMMKDGPVAGPEAAKAKIKAAPVIGNKKGLTILAEFPDDSSTGANDPINFATSRAKMVRFCNEVGYNEDGNTGSIRDFFSDQSGGKLNYTQVVTEVIKMPKARNYYNFSDYPRNTEYRWDAGRELLKDAIAVLEASNFDFTALTKDASNNVATNIFFAGPDSGVWAQGLWPHQWSLATPLNVGTPASPMYINAYQITNNEDSNPVIGTFCHENGHLILDYPDLYDTTGGSEGVGEHCLMGSGNHINDGKTPSPINAYFKDLVGWENVIDIKANQYMSASLPSTGNISYRIKNNSAPNEYFMVENRGPGDKWAEYSEDKGIAIWHIDNNVSGNDDEFMTENGHYQVSLEQADGQFDLEFGVNRGDGQDLFDILRDRFTDSSTPNARWWDGSKSGVKIKVLSGIGASMKVRFGSLPTNTILVGTPNGEEVIFKRSKYTIKWEANIQGNVKIDLYKNAQFVANIAKDEENDGSFEWEVTNYSGTDYSIRITSLTNPVKATDSSDKPFEISSNGFPLAGKMPHGWFKPEDAEKGWKVTKSDPYEGGYCLTSDTLGDGKTAAVAYRSNFLAGNLSFYIKVESEQGYDVARFYIDGKPQTIRQGAAKLLTGKSGWVFVSYSIPAGRHTFRWNYEKDDSYATGEDAAWIDGVSLPPTTQEIVVQNPSGVSLESGVSKFGFPDHDMGFVTKPRTFTIKNTGGADLFGIKINKVGENSSEFVVASLGKTVLAPGQSTTFTVAFAPKSKGLKTAQLRIVSNDSDESPFAIDVSGTGLGLPSIAVYQPVQNKLKDDVSKVAFGYAIVGATGRTRSFTILNKGSVVLTNFSITKSGKNPGDFNVQAFGQTALYPGESTTFEVTFFPSRRDERTAEIHISSNDKVAGRFDVKLVGQGVPKQGGTVSSAGAGSLVEAALGSQPSQSAADAPQTTSVEVVGGQKYMTLTVTKSSASQVLGTVEVSSNLMDWYSGSKHTTLMVDDATTLKVRDNTPVSADSKRYIRLYPQN